MELKKKKHKFKYKRNPLCTKNNDHNHNTTQIIKKQQDPEINICNLYTLQQKEQQKERVYIYIYIYQ